MSTVPVQILTTSTLPSIPPSASPMLTRMASSPQADADAPLLEQLQNVEYEVEAIQRKRDQYLSEERAWNDALGVRDLEELQNVALDLREKLQATEQDFFDFKEGSAEVADRSENLMEERHREYLKQAQVKSDTVEECEHLKMEANTMTCSLASAAAAEKELVTSRRLLENCLKASSQAMTPDAELLRSRQRATKQLAAARRTCTSAQTLATQAESALRRARRKRSTEEAAIETANGDGPVDFSSADVHDPMIDESNAKAKFWNSLCERSQSQAKAWQARAERAAARCNEAETKAKQAQEAFEALMPGVDAMTAQVRIAKRELERVAWEQKTIGTIMMLLVLLTLIQILGFPKQLPIIQDAAPTLVFFAAGVVIVALMRSLPPMLREHIHANPKVVAKTFSDTVQAVAGTAKSKKC